LNDFQQLSISAQSPLSFATSIGRWMHQHFSECGHCENGYENEDGQLGSRTLGTQWGALRLLVLGLPPQLFPFDWAKKSALLPAWWGPAFMCGHRLPVFIALYAWVHSDMLWMTMMMMTLLSHWRAFFLVQPKAQNLHLPMV